jgi:hypothetical protein
MLKAQISEEFRIQEPESIQFGESWADRDPLW